MRSDKPSSWRTDLSGRALPLAFPYWCPPGVSSLPRRAGSVDVSVGGDARGFSWSEAAAGRFSGLAIATVQSQGPCANQRQTKNRTVIHFLQARSRLLP